MVRQREKIYRKYTAENERQNIFYVSAIHLFKSAVVCARGNDIPRGRIDAPASWSKKKRKREISVRTFIIFKQRHLTGILAAHGG